MTWKNVKIIFHREVRDQLRDRRTLFMVAVLPLLLYPALGIGMVQMMVLFSEQPRTVVVLGANHLPDEPALLDADTHQFNVEWFGEDGAAMAGKLRVISDHAPPASENEKPPKEKPRKEKNAKSESDVDRGGLLQHARRLRELAVQHAQRAREIEALKPKSDDEESTEAAPTDDPSTDQYNAERPASAEEADEERAQKLWRLEQNLKRDEAELGELFSKANLQVLVIVPQGFADRLERSDPGSNAKGESNDAASQNLDRLTVLYNGADEKSAIAYRRVRDAIRGWEDEILGVRLRKANLSESFAAPVNASLVDVAQPEARSAGLWSRLLPALLVIMAVTGAFYPAIDLAAGEKERGTMETLLICPASRTEIVLGKFFTVMLFSMSTAVLNLVSMGLTSRYMVALAGGFGGGTASQFASLTPPSLQAVLWILVLLVPLAALFSALCLSLATFARSSKEGQHYLTPLLMVTLGLTMFSMSPVVEIRPFYSVLPVMGPTLLLKEVLSPTVASGALWFAIPVLISSVGYSVLALWWAIDQFKREDVLFREAERIDLKLWMQQVLRDKEPTPSFIEAGFCVMIVMFLQFFGLRHVAQSAQAATSMVDVFRLQNIYLLATVATPAMFMGLMLTTSVRRTFRLNPPGWKMTAAALVLPVMLHVVTVELMSAIGWMFPDPPEGLEKVLAAMGSDNLPWWLVLATFAVMPAFCEEIAFRGFILSGFNRSRRTWLAIVLSSLAFGVVHTIVQQQFNAALLGLVLGLLAIRSNSLFAAILFHFVYNATQVVRSRVGTGWVTDTGLEWFFTTEGGVVGYRWPTLVIAGIVSAALIHWLVRRGNPGGATSPAEAESYESPAAATVESHVADHPPVGVGRGS